MRYFVLLLIVCSLPALSSSGQCNLPSPTGIKFFSVTSCKINMKWKSVWGSNHYTIQYKAESDTGWTVLTNVGLINSYTFSGLQSATTYQFSIAAVCSNGAVSSYSNLSQKTGTCSVPVSISFSSVTSTAASVTWSAQCSENIFNLFYKTQTATTWTKVYNTGGTSYSLTNLLPETFYNVKIQSNCGTAKSFFSPIFTFKTLPASLPRQKNVLLILVDDSRQDSYRQPFFNDTTIRSIATGGAEFNLCFPALSLCAPSRATIATGVYPHIHNVTQNPLPINSDTLYVPTVANILHDHGYYNGFIGKWHLSDHPQPGYDYWMEYRQNQYFNVKWNINGTSKKVNGHLTDVATDSALGFLKRVPPGKNFFLFLAYYAPHRPYDPRTQDIGIFDSDTLPFPSNFAEYTRNFPSFMYNCQKFYGDSSVLRENVKGYYELLNGVEVNLNRIFSQLKATGIFDSTLIIYTSDNGYLFGEHDLMEKRFMYEESLHLPLYLRYPKMIPAGTYIPDQMAMNIDIAPTILDFAGIHDSTGMQGISLLKFINGDTTRQEFMYELFSDGCMPDMRGIRSLNYKYTAYHCDNTTEEFFDLVNDPNENVNLINNSEYADLIQNYRSKLAYWQTVYRDTGWSSVEQCQIDSPSFDRIFADENELPYAIFNLYPDPATQYFNVSFLAPEKNSYTLELRNEIGQQVYFEKSATPVAQLEKRIDVHTLPPGPYFLIVQIGDDWLRKKIIIQK